MIMELSLNIHQMARNGHIFHPIHPIHTCFCVHPAPFYFLFCKFIVSLELLEPLDCTFLVTFTGLLLWSLFLSPLPFFMNWSTIWSTTFTLRITNGYNTSCSHAFGWPNWTFLHGTERYFTFAITWFLDKEKILRSVLLDWDCLLDSGDGWEPLTIHFLFSCLERLEL